MLSPVLLTSNQSFSHLGLTGSVKDDDGMGRGQKKVSDKAALHLQGVSQKREADRSECGACDSSSSRLSLRCREKCFLHQERGQRLA